MPLDSADSCRCRIIGSTRAGVKPGLLRPVWAHSWRVVVPAGFLLLCGALSRGAMLPICCNLPPPPPPPPPPTFHFAVLCRYGGGGGQCRLLWGVWRCVGRYFSHRWGREALLWQTHCAADD